MRPVLLCAGCQVANSKSSDEAHAPSEVPRQMGTESSSQPMELWNLPLYKVSEKDMERDGFIQNIVYVIDSIGTSFKRTINLLNTYHPNFHLIAKDLRRAYWNCCRSVSGPLSANSLEDLQQSIVYGITRFRRAINGVVAKYTEYVDVASGNTAGEVSDIVDAYISKRRLKALETPAEDLFRERRVADVTLKETRSSRKVSFVSQAQQL